MPPRRSPRRAARRPAPTESPEQVRSYIHPEADAVMRPDVGTQGAFRKKKPPATYRYDSSLAPELQWDGQNPAREQGEALIRRIVDATTLDEARAAARELAAMSRPFLNWAGKAERLSFDVPTLPLFVHERLSTRAILESVKRHRSNTQLDAFERFGDPRHDYADQQLRAYEHREDWVNRMILGDSLVVMNSLLQYEGLGGQVQMIYIDPPYGVKFGSNFQPFVRKRDVKHNDDADMTREPEMVQAYRDTWELGLHSYLTYLRDRLLVARELLTPSGSVFVQISDENLHHVREVMDEVFGAENFVSCINVKKTTGAGSPSVGTEAVATVADYLLWYARDRHTTKYNQLYLSKNAQDGDLGSYTLVELPDGTRRRMLSGEEFDLATLPVGSRVFAADNLTSQTALTASTFPVEFEGRTFRPAKGGWKTNRTGMDRLRAARRLIVTGHTLRYVRYFGDFSAKPLTNWWSDTSTGSFTEAKVYAVQTSAKVVARCILMTTDPGDLVLDPTCGSGTTAYVAEQWGRRWITIDTSRVPLALARQRLLTATYPWYELKADDRGPVGGFVYRRRQNSKGEEVGGIVPHVTLKSIANDEPPAEEVLVDRPEVVKGITRVAGRFAVEATIPTPVDFDNDGIEDSGAEAPEEYASFVDRMIEVLRRSPSISVAGNGTITLTGVRPPARALSLSAEAKVGDQPVAIVFGPENGAVSEKLVFEASREAYMKGYTHLYVIGFAIQPGAREMIERSAERGTVPATYVNVTPDVTMGDLLKTTRASQIFSVCGQPDVQVTPVESPDGEPPRWQVRLLGLDVFDPVMMDVEHVRGNDVPCWMIDTDYDGLCFRAAQVFFPRTNAWDNLKRALKAEYDQSVWDHLAGDTSAPFTAPQEDGLPKREFDVAVKVIDERGNELMVVKRVASA